MLRTKKHFLYVLFRLIMLLSIEKIKFQYPTTAR